MKGKELGSRHPDAIMVYDNEDDILGAASIIADQVEEYRTIANNDNTARMLIELRPSVILFALKSVAESARFYHELVDSKKLNFPHYSILLCSNRESGVAFRCCIKGFFDNYFVYQPLYEKFRLKMIVHGGLMLSKHRTHYQGFHDENFEVIDDELSELIDHGSTCRQSLLSSIADCKKEIQQVVAHAESNAEQQQIEPKTIVEDITKNYVEPLLESLENDIKNSLDSMLGQMLEQKMKQQAQAQTSHQLGDNQVSAASLDNTLASAPSSDNLNQDVMPSALQSAQSTQGAQKGIASPPPAKREQADKPKSKRILVVEDNALYREMLVNVLSKERYDVDEAEDGLKALKKIKNTHYECVMMDLFMPQLDGLNTTKNMKKLAGGRDIPVIALTGNKKKELIRKWASLGLKGYIV